jgi:hypothetical protein
MVKLATGYEPMIYTSPFFWQSALANTALIGERGARLWQAEWQVPVPSPPADNWAGRGWTAWQWSDCGSVPGITGCVDMDVANGGLARLVMGAPNNHTPPTVGGRLRVGAVVHAHTGEWGGRRPLRFGVHWDRCDTDGRTCRFQKLGTSYRLTPGDVAHTLRLVVSVTNTYGQAWVEGPPTPTIIP